MVWELGEENLEKELVELLQFSGSTLALSKCKRLTQEKPGEEKCGGYERNPGPEVKTSIILGLGVWGKRKTRSTEVLTLGLWFLGIWDQSRGETGDCRGLLSSTVAEDTPWPAENPRGWVCQQAASPVREGWEGCWMEGGACQGALGAFQTGTAWGTKNRRDPGMERRGEVFEVGGESLWRGGKRIIWQCEWLSYYLRYSRGVLSPGRHVRTRLYFTSESHVHSLLSVFRYGGLLDVRILLLPSAYEHLSPAFFYSFPHASFSLKVFSVLLVSLLFPWLPCPWALAYLFLCSVGDPGCTMAASFGLS